MFNPRRALARTLLGFLVLSSSIVHAGWDLHDVSILLPLPRRTSERAFLAPSTQGGHGELLPEDLLAFLPRMAPEVIIEDFTSALQVVGVRVDPCFGTPCQAQIRLVFQPVIDGGEGVTTVDAAVHAFYDLTSAEFSRLMARLKELKSSHGIRDTSLPLGVHPTLRIEGLAGTYARELQRTLLDFIGVKKLSRMTFMTLDTESRKMWSFGGFDIGPGVKARTMKIPRVAADQKLQAFINSHIPRTEFIGGFRPAPMHGDTFNGIVGRSDAIGNPVIVRTSVESTHRIENPRLHSPATIDCASCHVAQSARLWAEKRFPDEGFDQSPSRFATTLKLNLENRSPSADKTHVLRAFGYNDTEPAISQRAINESAMVIEQLKKLGI